jgi:hypothetical protein
VWVVLDDGGVIVDHADPSREPAYTVEDLAGLAAVLDRIERTA